MNARYDKQAQHEWLNAEPQAKADWPLIICSIVFCVMSFIVLDSIAADIARW